MFTKPRGDFWYMCPVAQKKCLWYTIYSDPTISSTAEADVYEKQKENFINNWHVAFCNYCFGS